MSTYGTFGATSHSRASARCDHSTCWRFMIAPIKVNTEHGLHAPDPQRVDSGSLASKPRMFPGRMRILNHSACTCTAAYLQHVIATHTSNETNERNASKKTPLFARTQTCSKCFISAVSSCARRTTTRRYQEGALGRVPPGAIPTMANPAYSPSSLEEISTYVQESRLRMSTDGRRAGRLANGGASGWGRELHLVRDVAGRSARRRVRARQPQRYMPLPATSAC
jgi:hypothetical protein